MRITFAQWMKDTATLTRPRSKELKAVDEAFKKYELALENSTGSVLNERRALISALEAWKTTQEAKTGARAFATKRKPSKFSTRTSGRSSPARVA
jgi:hypothetical protein